MILPFANLDPEPDQQYFSDGLTEELIHALTRIPELRVIAWNTAAHFRAEQDLASIRDRLGVSTSCAAPSDAPACASASPLS